LAEKKFLQPNKVLIIDGPLRFSHKFKDITQVRNVIGLSKSFRPNFNVGKGRNKVQVGTLASGLDFGERTTVFRTTFNEKTIGVWYMRIHSRTFLTNPLQGVVKLECYAMSDEIENNISVDRIDTYSAHLLRERNVTPYGVDTRWASHIYPIYTAENYIKNAFMSDIHFVNLF
jgi:hypothetical protein